MSKAVWISYDLGVKGDYDGMYAFLDDHDATECGDSVAFFRVQTAKEGDEFLAQIKSDLDSAVRLSKTDRIYMIYRRDSSQVGTFLFGRRKASPWQGFGHASEPEDDS